MTLLIGIIFFAGGLILGSFFNVLIWRIPRGESIVFPSSHCPRCGRKLTPWENIPLLSYLALRGRCAGCHARISLRYPLVELATALAALGLWVWVVPHDNQPWSGYTVWVAGVATLLLMVPIAVIDLEHYIIPDVFTLPGLALALALSFVPGYTTPVQALLGALTGGGILWGMGWLGSVVFKKGDAMGGGDIKLMAWTGALWGPSIAAMTIVFGAFLGSFAGIALILFRKLKQDHRIPFGPFLAAGLWLAVAAGNELVGAYMRWVGSLVSR